MAERPLKFSLQYGAAHITRAIREGWYQLVRAPFDRVVWMLWSHGFGVPLSGLSRRNAFRVLGDATELWIEPQSLNRVISVRKAGFPKRYFISDMDWDRRDSDITDNHRYMMLVDLWANRNNLRASETFWSYQSKRGAGSRFTLPGNPSIWIPKRPSWTI